MATQRKVALIVGSLRKDSFTRKLALAATKLAPDNLSFELIEIGGLPLYNQDDEPQAPASWVAFRDKVRSCTAVLFATPEYNRGLPAALKNAIDVGSRPFGKSVWDGMPAATMSCSPGAMGGYGANHHLKPTLAVLNMPTLPAPEIYVPGVDKLLGPDGDFTADATRELMRKFMATFAAWIEATARK